ncbi:hypothetical protein EDB89DRAFT_1940390 [Lactarius sanguifluus]|nr:hypothetical protein EDB89DRAFT_1940390 [Lactarius sanguifluus]
MPASPVLSLPQSSRIESSHNHPLTEVADTPELPQPGTIPITPIPGVQERSATLESLLEALNRASMSENTTLHPTPLPPRAVAYRPQEPHGHRHVLPDPVIAGPNPPMAVLPPSTPGNQRQPRLSIAGRILVFFGYGRNNRARKELVSVIWALTVDFSQIVAIITLLTISTHSKSPTIPNLNEWDACGKPLGIWNALWVVRLSLDVWLSIWRWSRERTKRLQDESTGHANSDGEAQTRTYPNVPPPGGRRHGPAVQRNADNPSGGPSQPTPTPYPRVYARLSLMGSTFTLVWFVLSQIFVYSSTNTCRPASPHLWWLTFGVLSVMYLMILEVVLVAILVFVVGPILFLFWSILLLCLGRHPSQNPHHFTPDIGQVPRSVVDKLPLVLYIPPPPDQPPKPVSFPTNLHTYPPKSADPPPRRFGFFRRRGTSPGGTTKNGAGKGGPKRPLTWEDNWERGEYPFVQLDGHRASCAICLLDFQEPKRIGGVGSLKTVEDKTDLEVQAQAEDEAEAAAAENEAIDGQDDDDDDEVEEVGGDVTEQTTANGDNLRLQDAGQGAQPLRLLKCGHVFHKTCVDPWLLDVSGRCPVCQRPVRGTEPEETSAGTNQDARPSRRRWFRRSRRRGPA